MKVRGSLSSLLMVFLIILGLAGLMAAENPIKQLFINEVPIKVEIAETPEKIYQGLSGREALPEGRGMLFVMPSLEYQHFCMRGMLFPIDIIWIAKGRVIGLAPNLSPQDNRTFSSPAPADQVLEVPAGFCQKHQIRINHKVLF